MTEKLFQVGKMNRNYFFGIVVAAIICLFLIFFSLYKEIESPITKDPIFPSPVSPYKTSISGQGVIEAGSDNIMIGTPVNRIVDKIEVKVGEKVKTGEVLIKLENRDLEADEMSAKAAFQIAEAKVKKLESMPRPEDLLISEALEHSARLEYESARKQAEMVNNLPDPRALSIQEKDRIILNSLQAESKWKQAEADHDKIKAGTWKPDLEIAQLEVQQAKANLNRIQADIQRTIIKSPIDGTVLQIRIHEGESPSMDSAQSPLLIVGNIDAYFVRVSINQLDIDEFNAKNPATGFLQGDARISFPLEFVRIEPYLTSKQNLSNDVSERVDTRVMHIIYRIKNVKGPIYVGQQMDVFIETTPATK